MPQKNKKTRKIRPILKWALLGLFGLVFVIVVTGFLTYEKKCGIKKVLAYKPCPFGDCLPPTVETKSCSIRLWGYEKQCRLDPKVKDCVNCEKSILGYDLKTENCVNTKNTMFHKELLK